MDRKEAKKIEEKYKELECQTREEYYQSLLKQLTECNNDLGRLKILTSMIDLVAEKHIIKERFKNE